MDTLGKLSSHPLAASCSSRGCSWLSLLPFGCFYTFGCFWFWILLGGGGGGGGGGEDGRRRREVEGGVEKEIEAEERRTRMRITVSPFILLGYQSRGIVVVMGRSPSTPAPHLRHHLIISSWFLLVRVTMTLTVAAMTMTMTWTMTMPITSTSASPSPIVTPPA